MKGGNELKKFSKVENSWMMYDWANSAYSIIITTAVFPLFYKSVATNAGVANADSTAYLGYAVAGGNVYIGDDWAYIRCDCGLSRIKKEVFLFLFCNRFAIDCYHWHLYQKEMGFYY